MASLQTSPFTGVNGNEGVAVLNISVTVAAGDDLAMAICVQGEGDGISGDTEVASVSVNGDPATLHDRVSPISGSWSWAEIWKLAAPDIGTYNVVITLNHGDMFTAQVYVAEDVDQTTPLLTPYLDQGVASTLALANIVDCDAGDVLFDSLCIDGVGHSPTNGPGQNEEFSVDNTVHSGCSSTKTAIDNNEGMEWSWGSGEEYAYIATGFRTTTIPPQQLRPDADITTTGWTATPLWSKIEEVSPDGTVIVGTFAPTGSSSPPAVAAVVEGGLTSAGTSLAVTLPGGGASTDEYIVIIAKGSVSCTINALAGWTELLDEAVAAGLAIIRYTGAGVPSNPTFTQSASSRSVWCAYRITGANKGIAPEIGTTATATSNVPNPPSCAVTGGPKDILAIACFSAAGENADDDTLVTAFPTNYTSGQVEKAAGTAGTNLAGLLGAAARQVSAASSEDPGTFTQNASRVWRAQTIVVHPVPVPTATAVGEISLAPPAAAPATQTEHKIKARARLVSGGGELNVALYEGGTNRSGDISLTLANSFTEHTFNIPDVNAANITDYSNLSIRFWGDSDLASAGNLEIDQQWLEIPGGAGATTYNKTGALVPTTRIVGVDVSERSELGSLAADTHLAGVDASERSELGTLIADTNLSGLDATERSETGALVANTILAGLSFYEAASKMGSLVADSHLVGTDTAEHTRTGSLTPDTMLAGIDTAEHSRLGTLIADTLLAGASVKEVGSRFGSLIASVLLRGLDVAEHSETGSLVADSHLVGVDASERSETGSLVADTILAGADASERSETGSLIADTILAGIDTEERNRTGSVVADSHLAGIDLSERTETGSLVADTTLAGIGIKEGAGKAGAIVADTILAGIDAEERGRIGSLISAARLVGADVAEHVETGTLGASTLLAGVNSVELSRSGSLTTSPFLAGVIETALSKAGSLVAQGSLAGTVIKQVISIVEDTSKAVALIFRRGANQSTMFRRDKGWSLMKRRREED
jgi:hypothetical protein